MKNILCKLGFHKWEYHTSYMTELGRTIVKLSKCERCRHIKEKTIKMY